MSKISREEEPKISGEEESKISEEGEHLRLCSIPKVPERVLPMGIDPTRARLIIMLDKKWVNGTVLRYCFLNQPRNFAGSEEQKKVARDGFNVWKNVGIGVKFEEVSNPDDAQIHIGFERDDGFWSLVGRDILNEDFRRELKGRTMNLDQNLIRQPRPVDVATHEIGHTLGFPHEHQNPNAGIEWNEDAVYEWASRPPNRWPREVTHWNILRKIEPDEVEGSSWDPNSIMHYSFAAGLINKPEQYRNGLTPAGGISERDITWVRTFYRPIDQPDFVELTIDTPVPLALGPGEQKDFFFVPEETRTYDMATEGESDTVMVLFEERNGQRTQLAANDDSATDINAHIQQELTKGNRYVLSIRLYYEWVEGDTTVKVW